MKAIRLRTEYLKNPMGIDILRPRLFWNCEDGVTQTAYQILAETDGKAVWDSGKVISSQMAQIPYKGRLTSRAKVMWKVRLWDENGEANAWSEPAFFEMGLLAASDWHAQWITGNYKVHKMQRYPVDCFRKKFRVENVVKARLYATACGLYEGKLNGQRIGNFVLAPGYTDYKKRVQYQTYDVTALLKAGENELTFQLADGWYRGSVGAWGLRNQYGTQTKLLVQLEMTDESGKITTVCTDGSWQWSNDGPIRFADNKDGEMVDARMRPSYTGKAKLTRHNVMPAASNNVPVTEHERFKPTLITTPLGKTVLDFGQNIAGYLQFHFNAHDGQRVSLRFGEFIDASGEFTQTNIQTVSKKKVSPLQQVEYICAEGENNYQTKFAIFGFQYVQVETDVPFQAEDFTAIAVYSDIETTADFDCSNALLNQFVKAAMWSTKNNSADIPTDCPTRERHGWTGDAQIFFDTASYLFDYAAFSVKYMRDLYDWQKRSGRLPQIAPYGGTDFYMWVMNGSVGWSDAGIIIPYKFWKRYGDDILLRKFYGGMKKYAAFMIGRCGKWGGPYAKPLGIPAEVRRYAVNCGQSYGEWAEPKEVFSFNWVYFAEPHPEVSTAYTSYVMGLMVQIAEHLGKTEDIPLYEEYRDGCKKAYQALVRTKRYDLDTDRQAQLVRPLYFDLLDEEQTVFAKKRLMQAMEHYGWRVGTGFLSTPLILYVLGEIDVEAAYRLLENEELPGWLSMPKNGATTIWEGWEGPKAQSGISSLNHYSKGACLDWVFSTMCGITVDGENHFAITPQPGGHFAHAGLEYKSVYGSVACHWKKENGKLTYRIVIPANTTAELCLPGGIRKTLTAGNYTYEEAL